MQFTHYCPRCGTKMSAYSWRCSKCGYQAQDYSRMRSNTNVRAYTPAKRSAIYRFIHSFIQLDYLGKLMPPTAQWLANDAFAAGPSGKKRGVAALLAMIFGMWGIQYFYLCKNKAALLTIFISLITGGCWCVITLIQGIIMLRMNNKDFERKFVFSKTFFPVF